jgi:hypothetical protein
MKKQIDEYFCEIDPDAKRVPNKKVAVQLNPRNNKEHKKNINSLFIRLF